MKEKIREALLKSGAVAVGFAEAGEVNPEISENFSRWIGEGYNAGMEFLQRHASWRRHTDNVLPGAKSIISLAFSYAPEKWRDISFPSIAAYAYGSDYHKVIRKLLKPIVAELKYKFGGDWRICIDSAPLEERYWAVKSGIGITGLNCCLITEKGGSLVFLTEILTTLPIPPDPEKQGECLKCGKCMDVCPGKALLGNGSMDARKCINYLTIEKKDEFSEEEKKLLFEYPAIYGCDRCLRVCPFNHQVSVTEIRDFKAEPAKIKEYSPDQAKLKFPRNKGKIS